MATATAGSVLAIVAQPSYLTDISAPVHRSLHQHLLPARIYNKNRKCSAKRRLMDTKVKVGNAQPPVGNTELPAT